ncbi:MAG: aminotransferase class I/II-fold pyridoxal phosphate-dependent enzyme, partial [Gemmatimonadaceae bacterium]
FDGYRPPSIFEIPGARDVAIEFHSVSKTFNMTGWRCGWAVARPEIASTLAKVKSFVDTGTFMAVQAAAAAALDGHASWVPGNLEIFRARRDAAVEAFRAAGFTCDVPRATMYLWIELPDGVPSAAFAERMMTEEGVVVMPGSAFGAGGEGFFRVSFITSPARIAEAASRAERVLTSFAAASAELV